MKSILEYVLLRHVLTVLHRTLQLLIMHGDYLSLTDDIPHDGAPEEVVVTNHISATVIFISLATGGLTFTLVCLTFNFIFRKKK